MFNMMLCFVHALTIFNFFPMVQLERGLHGLEPVVVANFPTKKYSDEFLSVAEDAQYALYLIVEFLLVLVFCFFLNPILNRSLFCIQYDVCVPKTCRVYEFFAIVPTSKHITL